MNGDSSASRYKADMPQIPGVSSASRRPRSNPLLPLIAGIVVFGVLLFLAVRWFAHSKPAAPVRTQVPAQIEVPPAPPDPASLLPHADKNNPVIAEVADLAKPWSSAEFFIHDLTGGENVAATIVRIPAGSPNAPSGYYAFSHKAPSGTCPLEYITDLDKLHNDYDFRGATHPLIGNPCSHTLYDPLKTVNLPGNIWIRGAIVQGSDVRPPLGVEIKIQDKQILAIRTE